VIVEFSRLRRRADGAVVGAVAAVVFAAVDVVQGHGATPHAAGVQGDDAWLVDPPFKGI